MKAMRFELDVYRRQTVLLTDEQYSLWQKWNESQKDSDWETFVESVQEDVAEQMEFYIEDAEPIA